ncbi:circadian clock-controlled protein daywake-like [Toxorhynchites rutilus septentrionalis]|uniref:circadian clock-controlled protein daywake-like n=1 Tax=Toxorhynchites rutilus septentrionalis TaxID=329112 RepID=UPI002478E1FD|nr:circadian clock-controlled protein daywake-like [Toxorhynchites rutilus septentrionalis]
MKSCSVIVVVVLNLAVGFTKIAPVLEVCKRNDPALGQCIINVVEKIRPNIASGNYGENRNAPPLDPLLIDKIDIDHGPSFRANLRDISIAGVSGFVIRKIRDDVPNRMFNISAKLPSLLVKGKYDLDMNILLLKISGRGPFNLTLDDTLVSLKVKYFLEPKDGKNYLKFHPVGLKIKFNDARFYLKNLFNGDPALEEIGNQAINANPHVLLDEVKPSLMDKLTLSLTEISNAVVAGGEEDELLPSS